MFMAPWVATLASVKTEVYLIGISALVAPERKSVEYWKEAGDLGCWVSGEGKGIVYFVSKLSGAVRVIGGERGTYETASPEPKDYWVQVPSRFWTDMAKARAARL